MAILVLATIETTILTSKGGQMVAVIGPMAQVRWFCVAGEGDYRRRSGGFVSQVCVF